MEQLRRDMTRVVQTGKRYVARAVRSEDLSASEIQALRYVVGHDGLSQSGLCEHTGMDKGAVARLAARLEEKGYLRRESDPRDGRIKRLIPLEPARAVRETAIEAEERFYAWMLEPLTERERAQLRQLLERLFERAMTARKTDFAALLEEEEKR